MSEATITSLTKADLMGKFARKKGDTGSPEVQIAILTQKIEKLVGHFGSHVKDLHSQRGMMKMINDRKRLLAYLKREDVDRYRNTIAALNLRK